MSLTSTADISKIQITLDHNFKTTLTQGLEKNNKVECSHMKYRG
nr:hypothetical protein [Candidatus Freyarchaeota archaeon]